MKHHQFGVLLLTAACCAYGGVIITDVSCSAQTSPIVGRGGGRNVPTANCNVQTDLTATLFMEPPPQAASSPAAAPGCLCPPMSSTEPPAPLRLIAQCTSSLCLVAQVRAICYPSISWPTSLAF